MNYKSLLKIPFEEIGWPHGISQGCKMGTANRTMLGEQFPWSNMPLNVQKEEADIKGTQKEKKGRATILNAFVNYLETEKKIKMAWFVQSWYAGKMKFFI